MPLLALVIPVEVAAPVAVLVSITVAAVAVAQDFRHVQLRSAGWLVLATLPGIPLGLLLLKAAAESVVKTALAIVIISFSLFTLLRPRTHELAHDRFAWFFGFSAGVLGGAYGMNGPPLAIYGAMRRWSPEHFRATLQGYFLPASMVGMFGYWLSGLWTPAVSRFYLLALPMVFVAIFVGREINRRMHARRFLRYVHAGLITIGVVLLLQAWRKS